MKGGKEAEIGIVGEGRRGREGRIQTSWGGGDGGGGPMVCISDEQMDTLISIVYWNTPDCCFQIQQRIHDSIYKPFCLSVCLVCLSVSLYVYLYPYISCSSCRIAALWKPKPLNDRLKILLGGTPRPDECLPSCPIYPQAQPQPSNSDTHK